MSNIKDNLLQLIGKTPLVRLSNIYKDEYGTEIIAKVEYFNPGGSVKDRAAYAMIEAAETSGKLKKGGTIIEPTSGNTGIGMAWIAALKGYRTILTMPESMSLERRKLLAFLGCEVVLTPAASGMKGALDKAEELQRNTPGSIILQQFSNSANPMVHYNTTANEIMEDSDGVFDVFVACVGTGGTITGTGKRLKELKPNVKIVAVEPESSAVLSGGQAGKHSIQGIGAGFVPDNYDSNTVDKIIQVKDKEAFDMMHSLAKKEGLLVGISSGAAVSAAVKLASNDSYKGKRIIVLLPDTGERYLSMHIYINKALNGLCLFIIQFQIICCNLLAVFKGQCLAVYLLAVLAHDHHPVHRLVHCPIIAIDHTAGNGKFNRTAFSGKRNGRYSQLFIASPQAFWVPVAIVQIILAIRLHSGQEHIAELLVML